MRPRHKAAENDESGGRGEALVYAASMRPRHKAAENLDAVRARFILIGELQ